MKLAGQPGRQTGKMEDVVQEPGKNLLAKGKAQKGRGTHVVSEASGECAVLHRPHSAGHTGSKREVKEEAMHMSGESIQGTAAGAKPGGMGAALFQKQLCGWSRLWERRTDPGLCSSMKGSRVLF